MAMPSAFSACRKVSSAADQGRRRRFGAGGIEAVVHRPAALQGQRQRAVAQPGRFDEGRDEGRQADAAHDGGGLVGRDLAAGRLLPGKLGHAGDQDVGRDQLMAVHQQRARLRAQRLLDEPFDGDAGLDHHDHRSPPALQQDDAVGLRHVVRRHGGDAVGLGQGVEDQRLARGLDQQTRAARPRASGRAVRARAFSRSMILSSSSRMVRVPMSFSVQAQNPWRNQRAVGRPLAAAV